MAIDPKPIQPTTTMTVPPTLLGRVVSADASLSLRLHTLCIPIPRSFLRALEISGDGRFWFPVLIALVLYLRSSSPLLLSLLLGSVLDLLLVGLLKTLIRRPRPLYNKGMTLVVSADHWSFPSGHSSRVSFIAAFLCLARSEVEENDLLVRAVSLWAASTSVSRVLLGRHFLIDVLAGACLGLLEALFVFRFLQF